MSEDKKHIFTEEDVTNCWVYRISYLVDILNGKYDLEEARDDLLSLIGSEFDKRNIKQLNILIKVEK